MAHSARPPQRFARLALELPFRSGGHFAIPVDVARKKFRVVAGAMDGGDEIVLAEDDYRAIESAFDLGNLMKELPYKMRVAIQFVKLDRLTSLKLQTSAACLNLQ